MKILACLGSGALRDALPGVAQRLDAELELAPEAAVEARAHGGPDAPDLVLLESDDDDRVRRLLDGLDGGATLVVASTRADALRPDTLARLGAWLLLPTGDAELGVRLRGALARHTAATEREPGLEQQQGSEHEHESESEQARLEHAAALLYDRITGLPTLPVMIETAESHLEREGTITLLYIHFVWHDKIEETRGWQKLDDVLETTANALRDCCERVPPDGTELISVARTGDDDFVLLVRPHSLDAAAKWKLNRVSAHLRQVIQERIEQAHGEDVAALCGTYIGAATAFRNPEIRAERIVYRALREAVQAARGAQRWERADQVADLRATLEDGDVFIEYHPIVVTATEQIYGYEALARGRRRTLRSPEVLFEVAEEANLIWELSRLLRRRAVEGIIDELQPGEHLFLNIDPHDFEDPSFRNLDPAELGIDDPSRVVLEITERTAIKDYPRFQSHLTRFREQGFRFAVDDAGSGYAGLGSIANLAPDYIKLDISLISGIDTNILKQHLVETMVHFAEEHGALVVAEGVERHEELEAVRSLGVHLTQGFLFHEPRYFGAPARASR